MIILLKCALIDFHSRWPVLYIYLLSQNRVYDTYLSRTHPQLDQVAELASTFRSYRISAE